MINICVALPRYDVDAPMELGGSAKVKRGQAEVKR